MYTDIKCVIFIIACVLGYFSHFMCKFPADFMQVAGSVAAYAFLMTIHYYIESYLERDAFFISKSHSVSQFRVKCNKINLVGSIQEFPANKPFLDSEPR